MKKLLIPIVALLLFGCDQAPRTGADGYRFGEKQYTQTKISVELVLYPTREELDREINRRKLNTETTRVVAFTSLYKDDPTRCTIHMMDPSVEYAPEFVGHEFLHCVYGQWHKNNKSR